MGKIYKRKKNKVTKLKDGKITKFLKHNEVWFSTIASIALSIMALILTINSNNLTERQALVDYTTHQPDFKIYKSTYSSNNNDVKDNIEIIIKNNNNGVARNIRVSTRAFLIVETNKKVYKGKEIFNKKEPEVNKFFLLDQFTDIYYPNQNEDFSVRIRDFDIKHITHQDSITYRATQEQRFLLYSHLFNRKIENLNLKATFKRELYIELTFNNFLNETITEFYKIKLDNIHSESLSRMRKNDNATFLESKEEIEKIFNTKEKLNFISFVTVSSFEGFEEILNDENKYFFDDLDSILFRNHFRHPNTNSFFKKTTDSIFSDSLSKKHEKHFKSTIKKYDSLEYYKLLEEMKQNSLYVKKIDGF